MYGMIVAGTVISADIGWTVVIIPAATRPNRIVLKILMGFTGFPAR
jgi:hypothetical protein